jgi:hypothetical protein
MLKAVSIGEMSESFTHHLDGRRRAYHVVAQLLTAPKRRCVTRDHRVGRSRGRSVSLRRFHFDKLEQAVRQLRRLGVVHDLVHAATLMGARRQHTEATIEWRTKPSLRENSASFPVTMTDGLDARILDMRVMGVPEREICRRLGVTIAQIHAVLDAHARVKFAPENIERMLVESFDRIRVIERTLTPRAAAGDVEALKLVAQCRRQ